MFSWSLHISRHLKIFHFDHFNVKNGIVYWKSSGNLEKAWTILFGHIGNRKEEYADFIQRSNILLGGD